MSSSPTRLSEPSQEQVLGDGQLLPSTRLSGRGPSGQLPLAPETLLREPSGRLFGMTQSAGMGWNPEQLDRPHFLLVSTQGGLRDPDGSPVALGYHTGHWEIGLLVRAAAEELRRLGGIPFSATVSDPCDGRSQGTTAMFDSLPYRNDAALTMRRLIRSLPERRGVMGIATCDKGLPAMLLALAGSGDRPGIVVPGGVTLPAEGAEDAGTVQSLGARFAHGLVSLEYARDMGCRACGSPGGGCQFLGTAATSQVVAEALGLSLPHSALCPSGEPVWLDMARRSAMALVKLTHIDLKLRQIINQSAIENAMVLHAAFGGSTNLLLHLPAVAHAARVAVPTLDDWLRINRATPRLVDALPNGPRQHPTVQVFMAGGVPEAMLHLRRLGLLDTKALTVTGENLGSMLDWWEQSERRRSAQSTLRRHGVEPAHVIMDPASAQKAGLERTLVFPRGNLAPEGSVVKATAIDRSTLSDGVYQCRARARVFTSEADAIAAIKGVSGDPVRTGDVVVYIGGGPLGTGMEETYQLTAALTHVPWGKHVPVLTDARFSGVSTGPCVGHIGPEALAGGPLGKLRDGDLIQIHIDAKSLTGSIDLVGTSAELLGPDAARALLAERSLHPDLRPHPDLPEDTRLWAALQRASGGTWAGCVYDVDQIIEALERPRPS